jgi:hypothetical protein
MKKMLSQWKECVNKLKYLCKIIKFDVNVNDSTIVENEIHCNGETSKSIKIAQTIKKTVSIS